MDVSERPVKQGYLCRIEYKYTPLTKQNVEQQYALREDPSTPRRTYKERFCWHNQFQEAIKGLFHIGSIDDFMVILMDTLFQFDKYQ